MSKQTFVAVVQAIILQAEEIEKLSMFQQPAAAKALLKDEIVPFLLTVAEKLDAVDLTQFNSRLDHNNKEIEAHGKKITSVERQVKQLLKPAKAE